MAIEPNDPNAIRVDEFDSSDTSDMLDEMKIRALILTALIPVSILFSQTQATQLAIRKETTLVQMDVIAEDRRGHPITNLQAEQFQVYDDGKAQRIAVFRNYSDRGSLPENVDSAPAVASSTAPLSPSRQRHPDSITIVLIDSLNTNWTNQAYANQQLVNFLRQADPSDHIGVYSMGRSGLRVIYDHTRDASELLSDLRGQSAEYITNQVAGDVRQSSTEQSCGPEERRSTRRMI